MDENSVCANIAELVTRLNGELEAAFRLGLKVTATTHSGAVLLYPQPERISIRVWRETEMVHVPALQRTGLVRFSLLEKDDVKR